MFAYADLWMQTPVSQMMLVRNAREGSDKRIHAKLLGSSGDVSLRQGRLRSSLQVLGTTDVTQTILVFAPTKEIFAYAISLTIFYLTTPSR